MSTPHPTTQSTTNPEPTAGKASNAALGLFPHVRLSKDDRAAAALIVAYFRRHKFNHGTVPPVAVGFERSIHGFYVYDVRNRDGAGIAYVSDYDIGNTILSGARRVSQ